ncbi:polymorphic toxin-type HINT domain-containing protein [Kitasatospora sp. NBC_01250]|uniref:polymorphic toxin-type HINT domain-containing protein n=1 Tax=Kitasatospora sp. NBC_01250 TaxID=2903571 RepID=UPI002E32133F|nr:polymorphic toxin-type HINT domain-containing protein [Kitasatospora sp. NBC_01250]
MSLTSRARVPRLAVGLVAGSLLTGLLAIPAAADTTPAAAPNPDRVKVVAAWQSGGPAVRRAAETALTGTGDDLTAFLTKGQATAADQDLRAQIEQIIATSGPGVRAAGTAALAGSAADLQKFITKDGKKAYEDDQRVRVSQLMSTGGPGVKAAAAKAMDGTLDDVNQFLNEGQFKARDDDDRVHLTQLMASGGPEVKKAANTALNGTMDDVQQFLQYGYQTAAAHDQETLTVGQLADLTKTASDQAGQQAQTAKDAAGQAVDATLLAKQAAERASAETKAAQNSAGDASNAAGRAADAAGRAADAAQTASAAAKAANEAARQAANAAANAAAAATKAGNAAAAALSAAAAAGSDASKADAANKAAATARDAAVNARTAAEASQWADVAATQAGAAAQSAASAGANAAAAAQAAADAATYTGVADSAAYRARQAAARARTAAAEATRAANATVAIANQAAAAAGDAQRAANDAAAHADAAATAAEEAAKHAGDASNWANTAQTAATAAGQAADSAASSATQAHKVADIARASDQERLNEQQADEMAAADQASRDADLKAKTSAWQAGQVTQFAADTDQLIKDATAPGVDQKTAVLKGRQAALRLLDSGGPWTKAAAQTALEGDDSAVQAFLSTNLATARDRDDRSSVMAIAQAPGKLEKRLAAETASVGTPDQVRAFLTTGQYPGKDDDDRVLLSQIMAAGGPGVKAAAGKALSGTIDDVRAFLATGQYTARDDDNRVLVSQAIATGGPEVKAAAQAVMSGPASGLEPFLQTGLLKAQQRDAVTAAHVATIQSYLATIDGSVALAREYAAQAAQSAATARGAANDAAGYANQAGQSAQQAQGFADQAAQSAQQAKASADQAATYAQQAQTAAASANAAASRATASAAMATSYAAQAQQYAASAKTAADQAQSSAAAAQQSAQQAAQAAADAQAAVWQKQQAEALAAQTATATTGNEGVDGSGGDGGRAYYVEVVPHDDVKQEIVKSDMSKCIAEDPTSVLGLWDKYVHHSKTWHDNASGQSFCTVPVKVKVTGTVDYVMRTCPEAGLSLDACKGKYTTWDSLVLSTQTLDGKTLFDDTIELSYDDYAKHYKVYCDPEGGCASGDSARLLFHLLTDDFVKCFNNPGLNASCGWAAASLIPAGKLTEAAKGMVAFRYALETGVGIEDAKLALQATLNGYNAAVVNTFGALADNVAKFRATLKDGAGTDAALAALRNDPTIDHALFNELQNEADLADGARTSCPVNSFPAGTGVVMADGTSRAIETLRVGDKVLATDPATGATAAEPVVDTYGHATTRLVDIDTERVGRITSTVGHRFYVDGAGWREVSDLHVGDVLLGSDGVRNPVTGLHERAEATQSVYDLTVDGLHTFYVRGSQTVGAGILVHNCFDLWGDERGTPNRAADPRSHTIKKHVAQGPWGPNGETAGVTPAEAAALTTATDANGVFSDLSIANDALRSAIGKSNSTIATWLGQGGSDFKEFTVDVDVMRNGQRLTTLGKVYPPGGSVSGAIDSGTKVRVRLVKALDKHNGKSWTVSSIYPLAGR